MKRFLKKIGLFLLIVFGVPLALAVLTDIFIVGNQHEGNYMASLVDKVHRLKSIDEPKIILVSNSNLAFGINSRLIEDAFGMPVVNMGLHGGLGSAFHENMAKLGAKKGDIVIVCHHTYSDDGKLTDPRLAWITLEKHWELYPILRAQDIIPMLRSYPYHFKASFRAWKEGGKDNIPGAETSYSRSAFNEYGDIAFRPAAEQFSFTQGSVGVPAVNGICTKRLNRLNSWLKRRGATLLIAGYPVGFGEFTPPAEEFDAFEKSLRAGLDCEVISHFTDYFIPYDLFYDTNLHLSEEGAEMRTNRLIADLQDWGLPQK